MTVAYKTTKTSMKDTISVLQMGQCLCVELFIIVTHEKQTVVWPQGKRQNGFFTANEIHKNYTACS